MITIIPSADIDANKWNACISQSKLLYGQFDYINHMADQWDGIVVDDYKIVMPVPWRKKWGIKYYYQPAFTQQLGIFGQYDDALLLEILRHLQQHCRYGDVFFNHCNSAVSNHLNCTSKTNLILDLSVGYEAIKNSYNRDLTNNLKRAQKFNLSYSIGRIEDAIQIYKNWYGNRFLHVTAKDYQNFQALCNVLTKTEQVLVRTIKDANEHTLSIGLFLKDDSRIYNMMNSTGEEGRKKEANSLLLDLVIQEFSGTNLLFDFEGSDLPGVKSFYEKFGAINQPYFHWHHNTLPALLQLIKK